MGIDGFIEVTDINGVKSFIRKDSIIAVTERLHLGVKYAAIHLTGNDFKVVVNKPYAEFKAWMEQEMEK